MGIVHIHARPGRVAPDGLARAWASRQSASWWRRSGTRGIPGQPERPTPPPRRPGPGHPGVAAVHALEEVAHPHAERPGDGVEPPGRDSVGALLVLVGPLVGDPDQPGRFPLRQPERGRITERGRFGELAAEGRLVAPA